VSEGTTNVRSLLVTLPRPPGKSKRLSPTRGSWTHETVANLALGVVCTPGDSRDRTGVFTSGRPTASGEEDEYDQELHARERYQEPGPLPRIEPR
jgi:hypothetical protein